MTLIISDAGLQRTRKSQIYIILLTFLVSTGALRALTAVLRDPGSVRALTSIADNPEELPIYVKLPVSVTQFVIIGFHLYGNWLQTSSIVCYGMDLVNAVGQFHTQCFRSGNYLQYALQHRALQVLQANFSQLYPTYLLAIELYALSIVVVNLYMAVQFHSVPALILAVGHVAAYCWGMGEFAAVHETCVSSMEAWSRSKHVERNIWFRKFLRSCKPVRIPLSSFFYIDRGFVLTVMSIMIDSTANLIIAG